MTRIGFLTIVAGLSILIVACSDHSNQTSSLPTLPASERVTPSYRFIEYNVPTSNAGPLSIIRGPDGALWFTEAFAPNIGRIDVNGNITEFPVGGHGQNFLAVGPDGNLWFTESSPDIIGQLTTSGGLTEFTVSPPSFALEYIVRGPDRRMWFENIAEDNGSVFIDEITVSGSITQYGPVDQACYFPFGMTIGVDSNLWSVGGRCLSKITPSGQITSMYLGRCLSKTCFGLGLNQIVHARDGNLWATDDLLHPPVSIDKITYTGSITHHYVPNALYNLYSLIQVRRNIFFAEQAADHLGRINETTFKITEYPVPTPNAEPSTLAEGPDGNIWFTEFGTDKIGVLILH
jgi:streptogramin lyase